ncbi:MAG: 4-hydroxybenzoate octaprenyltransferase [Rhodomicrobium sp.]
MRAITAQADTKSAPEGTALGPIADALPANWTDRFAPAGFQPWLRLIRADRPIGAWLLLWPCWWSVALSARADDLPDVWFDIRLLILFAIGAFAMRSAGCIYNDIIDRDIDAKVARTKGRPLASGQISLAPAIAVAIALCLAGLAVLLQFNSFAVALGFGSVGIVLIYPLMKRVTFWPQAVLGLAFSWGALMGWAAYFGELGLAPIVLYAAAVAWTIGYDTIYAHQDKDDDALMGLKSTALKFGGSTASWLSLFYGITIGGLAFSGWFVGAGILFYCGLIAASAHLIWQVATLDIDDPQNCLERFRSNHSFGAIVFLAIALDAILFAL